LRDFESILLFFSEEEVEELQAAIAERRSRRLARDGKDCPESEEQPPYSSNVGEIGIPGSSNARCCMSLPHGAGKPLSPTGFRRRSGGRRVCILVAEAVHEGREQASRERTAANRY
jgi:hypothetical protein